ncbi:MAG: bifunctional diaminohydroxyphosphoribosylaminopyrimidine deaminase/5-amino-6-(5-phosphoribosylamino)uracil reductase RibD [Vicinamibacteria bacterium]
MRKAAPAPLVGADLRFMRRAIELAERGIGATNPNPAVGCVIVRQGRVVGEGFHARAGLPHAEVVALAAAKGLAQGATAYVSLEPCAPHPEKRTPPCAPRLEAAGIGRVVYGTRDLNPGVNGAGSKLMRSAGLEVLEALSEEAARLTQHFNGAMKAGRPFITLKSGMTLDGRIATSAGESRWITSPAQRAAARGLRHLFDGVLIGIETALSDDPILLPVPRAGRPFRRVVLDSRLRLPIGSRLVSSAAKDPLIVVCASAPPLRRQALEERGVILLTAPGKLGRVSIPDALSGLFHLGVLSLMVEGGSEIHGSFVREGTFDEMVIFRAPLILGGRGSRSVVGGENPRHLSDAVPMKRSIAATCATLHYGLPNATALDVEVYERKKLRKR